MAKVKFVPIDREIELLPDETVLAAAQRTGVFIKSLCKGIPSCAECKVRLMEGEDHVFPPSRKEINLIGSCYFVDSSRLSCQLRAFGDIVVDVSGHEERVETHVKKLKKFKGQLVHAQVQEGVLVLEEPVLEESESSPDETQNVEPVEVEESVKDKSGPADKSRSRRSRRRPSNRSGNKD